MRIDDITAVVFPIPLIEPFTISRASVASSRAVLVRARVSDARGTIVEGLGEAALPLGSPREPSDLAAEIGAAGARLSLCELDGNTLSAVADEVLRDSPVARAGLHTALSDAVARLAAQPLYALLGASAPVTMTTDITLPIADPEHRAELAKGYFARGFRHFKIKVGADPRGDARTIALVAAATPLASLALDANEAFSAGEALELLAIAKTAELFIDNFEQPCKRDDVAGLRQVRAGAGGVPIVADESVHDLEGLERLVRAEAVDGINLKLVKMGGIDRCLTIGRAARRHGLRLMVGAMIESRLGLTAMAHVVAALGGVDWIDLDTAFLLASDPYDGGMQSRGAELTLPPAPGLGMTLRIGADQRDAIAAPPAEER